jgi:hypothetical protein
MVPLIFSTVIAEISHASGVVSYSIASVDTVISIFSNSVFNVDPSVELVFELVSVVTAKIAIVFEPFVKLLATVSQPYELTNATDDTFTGTTAKFVESVVDCVTVAVLLESSHSALLTVKSKDSVQVCTAA